MKIRLMPYAQRLIGEKLVKVVDMKLAKNEGEPSIVFFSENDDSSIFDFEQKDKGISFRTAMIFVDKKVMIKMQPSFIMPTHNRDKAYALANEYNMNNLSKVVIIEVPSLAEDGVNRLLPVFEISTGINETFTTDDEISENLSKTVDFIVELYKNDLKKPVLEFIDKFEALDRPLEEEK